MLVSRRSEWDTCSFIQVRCGEDTSSSPKRFWNGCDGPQGVCTRGCGVVVSFSSDWNSRSVVQVCVVAGLLLAL